VGRRVFIKPSDKLPEEGREADVFKDAVEEIPRDQVKGLFLVK